MKEKFNILFLIFISYTLMGCPAGSFYRYTQVDMTENERILGETIIVYDDVTELHIQCGNYIQFIRPKEKGLLATIKVISKEESENEVFIDKIVSSKFGELFRTQDLSANQYMFRDTLNMLYYTLSLKDLNQRKIDKRTKNDTISIALKNGTTLFFVKKESY